MQEIVWIPWDSTAQTAVGGRPLTVPVEQKPVMLWTLGGSDPNTPPVLPIQPIHGVNAFVEDVGHDWMWRNGKLRYFSRIARAPGNWVLLEY